MCEIGDYIYYYRKVDDTFETVPARIIKVNKKTYKIEADFKEGQRQVNVKKENCELQENWLKDR